MRMNCFTVKAIAHLVIFSIIATETSGIALENKTITAPEEQATAQTDSEMLGGLLGGGKKAPPPALHEIGGTDINLVSANQSSTGQKGSGSGKDSWLGGLPGMEGLKGLFAAQVDNNSLSE